MSLINDALKRVSEAERGKPVQQETDFATRSLQPAEYERRSSPALWIMLPVLLVAVGVGGFLLAKQKQPTQDPVVSAAKSPARSEVIEPAQQSAPVQSTTPVAEVKPAPVATHAVASSAAPVPTQSAAPTVAVTTSSTSNNISTTAYAPPAPTASVAPTPAQPAPAPVSGPTFRLKGILYTKNPTALINDGSAQVGGEIDGAKVTKINRTSVELEYEGKITILKLGSR